MAHADALTNKDNLIKEKKQKPEKQKKVKIKKPTIDAFPMNQFKPIRIRKSDYMKNDYQTHKFPAHKIHNPSTMTVESSVVNPMPPRPNDSHSQMLKMEEEFEKNLQSILGKHMSLQKYDT